LEENSFLARHDVKDFITLSKVNKYWCEVMKKIRNYSFSFSVVDYFASGADIDLLPEKLIPLSQSAFARHFNTIELSVSVPLLHDDSPCSEGAGNPEWSDEGEEEGEEKKVAAVDSSSYAAASSSYATASSPMEFENINESPDPFGVSLNHIPALIRFTQLVDLELTFSDHQDSYMADDALDMVITTIAALTHLHRLSMSYIGFNFIEFSTMIQPLVELTELEFDNVCFEKNLTRSCILPIAACPQLLSLRLDDCDGISFASFRLLSTCLTLRELTVVSHCHPSSTPTKEMRADLATFKKKKNQKNQASLDQ
jgi:hypothetical protein